MLYLTCSEHTISVNLNLTTSFVLMIILTGDIILYGHDVSMCIKFSHVSDYGKANCTFHSILGLDSVLPEVSITPCYRPN